jgi:hypothetical protein
MQNFLSLEIIRQECYTTPEHLETINLIEFNIWIYKVSMLN